MHYSGTKTWYRWDGVQHLLTALPIRKQEKSTSIKLNCVQH